MRSLSLARPDPARETAHVFVLDEALADLFGDGDGGDVLDVDDADELVQRRCQTLEAVLHRRLRRLHRIALLAMRGPDEPPDLHAGPALGVPQTHAAHEG